MINPLVRSFAFPDAGAVMACLCSDARAVFEIGDSTFIGQFNGSIAARIGKPTADAAGRTRIPMTVVAYTTTSDMEGIGRVTLDFDYTRSVRDSSIRAAQPKAMFPAVQTMELNIFMTSDVFGTRLLRTVGSGKLVNSEVTSVPPEKGATYRLQKPVELVDAKRPGKVLARVLEVNTSIVGSETVVQRLDVGRGVTLFPLAENFNHFFAQRSPKTPVKFAIEQPGTVEVRLLDRNRKPLKTAFRKRLKAGTHEVSVDTSDLKAREAYYQLVIDNAARTAPMLLLRNE